MQSGDTMISAADRGFEERKAHLPNFTASHKPDDIHHRPVTSDCKMHHLKYKDQTVLLHDIVEIEQNVFQGTIKGFEPVVVESYDGMTVGNPITYKEKHIFHMD